MSLARRFVDLQLAREWLMLPGDIPDEMRDRSIPSHDDWEAWKPIPSTVTVESLAAFEKSMALLLPQPFREFLSHVHFLDLNAPNVRFLPHPPEWQRAKQTQQEMRLFDEDGRTLAHVRDLGLFVIGDDQNDGGPVCLELRRARADGDCPVVLVDHESGVRTTLFSSTDRMFACFSMAAETDVDFFRAGDDDEATLIQKRVFLKEFLSLDPEGAGGPGLSFWSPEWRGRD